MFRMLRLKPPNGWNAVGWELVIVTVGVMIALAAQQWADDREWHAKVRHARQALRLELASHYNWSVEWRVVKPCLASQIDALQQRVLASGNQLDPAPVFTEPGLSYVIRLPSKEYVTSAWDSARSDGILAKFDLELRNELDAHYAQVRKLDDFTGRNGVDYRRLLTLSRPIPLDASVRHSILQTLDELRGRVEVVDLLSGHVIDHVATLGMAPDRNSTERAVERWSTFKFCRAQRLPMRSLAQAMVPVPG